MKLLRALIFNLFLVLSFSVIAENNLKLIYNFERSNNDLNIQTCLFNSQLNRVLWLIPFEIKQKNRSFSLLYLGNKKTLYPKYDYIETLKLDDKICIEYTVNNIFKKNNNELLLLVEEYLLIPETIFKNDNKVEVKFNWLNFNAQILSNKQNNLYSLDDLNSKFFAINYKADSINNKNFIHKNFSSNQINKLNKIIDKIDNFLKYKFNIALYRINNNFIFKIRNLFTNEVGGKAFIGKKSFTQTVFIKKQQQIDNPLMLTFTHEYIHKIIGGIIRFRPEYSAKEYWFKEGFTDYLASRILYETNIWTINDYKEFYNKRLYNYYVFNMNEYSSEDLHDSYFLKQSGYNEGMFYASYLNEYIRKQMQNKNDLLDFLKYYISLFPKKYIYFSNDSFYKELTNFINSNIDIKSDRKPYLLSKTILNNKLELSFEDLSVPIYKTKLYDIFKNFKYNNGDVTKIIPLPDNFYFINIVNNSNETQTFLLTPNYKYKFIPQYKVKKNL